VALMSVMLVGMTVGLAELSRTPQLVSFQSGPKSAVGPAAKSFEAAEFRPVAAVQSARPVMVKAVMPQKRVRTGGTPDRVSRLPNAEEPGQRRRSQASETLVEWRQESVPAAITLTFSQDSQFRYAAIRVPDGWLIVQL